MNYYDAILKRYLGYRNMPMNVLAKSSYSQNNGNKTEASLFVQKPYLKTNYNEANIEEHIDMRNQIRSKILPCPIENRDAACKSLSIVV